VSFEPQSEGCPILALLFSSKGNGKLEKSVMGKMDRKLKKKLKKIILHLYMIY